MENAVLIDEVRKHSNLIKSLHRRLFTIREEERKRLAHILHDEIAQSLVGMKYSLSDIENTLDPKSISQIKKLQNQLRDILTGLRSTIAGLSSPALDSLGLTSLIRSRVIELNSIMSFVIYLTIIDNHRVQLSDTVSLTLYRCFQEAIVNVQKHAEADRVYVRLQIVPGQKAVLSVKDNGVGFKVPDDLGSLTKLRHFGLVGIKEQLEMLGGEVRVISNLNEGTLIQISIPLPIENQRIMGEPMSDFVEEET